LGIHEKYKWKHQERGEREGIKKSKGKKKGEAEKEKDEKRKHFHVSLECGKRGQGPC